MGIRRLWALALLGTACGGQAARPPKPPTAAPAPKPEPVVEAPDLSPVAAPAGLFTLGRIKRPTMLADTVAKWAGLPVGVRDVLPLGKDLDAVVAWDAPIEFAAVVSSGSRHVAVAGAISLGLTGTDAALNLARQKGYEVKRLAPGTYLVGATAHLSCAIAPSLGSASARLVCAHRESELEDLLPYVTRGLPNVALGQHDLELEFRVEPLRQRFAAEIGSARLFAGFVVRELSIDSPRFDTAVSDAAYAVADELVADVHDLDTLRVEGSLDEAKHEAVLETTFAFRDHKSWLANVVGDGSRHPGPAPDTFYALSAESDEGGYSQARDPHLMDGVLHAVLEISDAYLEHEKVGKATRARLARLIQAYGGLDGASVHGEGFGLVAAGPHDKSPATGNGTAWMVVRTPASAPLLKEAAGDLAGLFSDRAFRAALARQLKTDDKLLPSARAVPLTGPGIPAGSRAVVLKVPVGLRSLTAGAFGFSDKHGEADAPLEVTLGAAPIPKSTEMVFGYAANVKELAARFGQVLNPKGATLATRPELEPMRRFNAMNGTFTTLARALDASSIGRSGTAPLALAGLPHHGQAPILFEWITETGAAPKGLLRMTVPAGVFEDLPGLLPLLAGLAGSDR